MNTTLYLIVIIAVVSKSCNAFTGTKSLSCHKSSLKATTLDKNVVGESLTTIEENETNNSDASEMFPPPLTSLQRTKRAIEFYKRVLPVLAAYKTKEIELKIKKDILKDNNISEEDEEKIWNDIDEWGSSRIAETIQEMKGFYVKTGQVISTRVDLFPEAYTSKLQQLQDGIEPMQFEMVKNVVEQELLDGSPLSEMFATFDEEPLGSASIAQVHKATLLDGRTVAVKLQRPNVEPKLLGDVANLKRISKALAKSLPVDYYTVFCELGDALERELDFLSEAQSMKKINYAISHNTDGTVCSNPPVSIPLPTGELVSKRVLVMDFVDGVPLNKLKETMKDRGIEPGSVESKIAGRRILDSLSIAFGRMIFGAGFIHGDPHPGNIFIGEGAKVSLIDCGQVKSLPRQQRIQLAKLILAVSDYQIAAGIDKDNTEVELSLAKKNLAKLVREFGVILNTPIADDPTKQQQNDDDLACSVALLLFGDAGIQLPGGYSTNELSEMSPIKQVASFPQELVLLGRATVLLKGIAKSLNVTSFSLSERWAESCKLTIESSSDKPILPLWSKHTSPTTSIYDVSNSSDSVKDSSNSKIRFKQVQTIFKEWSKGKSTRFAQRIVHRLPKGLKTKLATAMLERQERKEGEAARRKQ